MKRRSLTRIASLMAAALLTLVTAGSAFAAEYDIGVSSVTITAGDAGQSVTYNSSTANDDNPIIYGNGTPTTNTVTIESTGSATAQVEIRDVAIDAPDGSAGITVNGSADITVTGDNTVQGGANHAGIDVGKGDTLTIDGDGTLNATAGETKGNTGTGAGIGGANNEEGGTIHIEGDVTVNATGAGLVTSSDGKNEYASGGSSAPGSAGIGGGTNGAGGDVTISDNATVNAVGGGTKTDKGYDTDTLSGSYSAGGAGIGAGGGGKDGGTVAISDSATVTAAGGNNAAGIGGASDSKVSSTGADVSITTTGTITATGGAHGAGIGGGARGNGGSVSVSNAAVNATGGMGAAGIGGGSGGYYGGANITVNGKKTRNVSGGDGGTFTLTSGTVSATGGIGAAGIGGGSGAFHGLFNNKAVQGVGGSGATVIVLGGRLTVVGGTNAVGIGCGSNADWDAKQNITVFSASTAKSAGSLSISGGSGSIAGNGAGYAAISDELNTLKRLYTDSDYDILDEQQTALLAGLFRWDPIVRPVEPTTPTEPAEAGDPTAAAEAGEPTAMADPTGTQGSTDSAIHVSTLNTPVGTVEIPENATPLASPAAKHWAFANLLCAICTGLISAFLLVSMRGKRENTEGDTIKKHRMLRIGSIAVFAVSVIVFILTEDLRAPMHLIDGYTPLMVGILLLQGVVAILSGKRESTAARIEK